MTSGERTTADRGLVHSTFVILCGNMSEAVSNLVIGMLLVRYLRDKAEFATYSQTMFLAQTLVAFAPLGLHRAFIYFFPRIENHRRYALRTVFLTTGLVFAFGALLFAARGEVAVRFGNPALIGAVPFVIGLMWAMNFRSVLSQVLVATKKFWEFGLMTGAISLTLLAVVFGVSRVEGLGVHGVLVAALVVNLAFVPVTLFQIVRLPSGGGGGQWTTEVWQQVRYSVPLALASLCQVVGNAIDRFIVMALYPPAVYATYDRGAVDVPFVNQIPYAFSSSLQPRLAVLFKEGKIRQFLDLWHESVVLSAKVMLPLMVFCFTFAHAIVVTVNTESYADSISYFRVYLFLMPAQITIYSAVLMTTGRTVGILWITNAGLVLNCALSLFLARVGRLGALGPAIGTVTVQVAVSAFYLALTRRYLSVTLGEVFPWRKLLRIAIVASATGLVAAPLARLQLPQLVVLLVGAPAYGIAYLLPAMAFGIVTADEISRLEAWLPGPAKPAARALRGLHRAVTFGGPEVGA